MPVESQGEPLKIGFNARQALATLPTAAAQYVVVELADDLSPGVISHAISPVVVTGLSASSRSTRSSSCRSRIHGDQRHRRRRRELVAFDGVRRR